MRLFVWLGLLRARIRRNRAGRRARDGQREAIALWGPRVSLLCGGLLAALLVVVTQSALPVGLAIRLWLLPTVVALTLGPVLWYRSPGRSDIGGNGGSGSRSGELRRNRTGRWAALPLLDAEQALARVRDHNRPRLVDSGPRRRAQARAGSVPRVADRHDSRSSVAERRLCRATAGRAGVSPWRCMTPVIAAMSGGHAGHR